MTHVALKIQRRRSPRSAVNEISIHHAVRRLETRPCPSIIALHESFLFDGHICMAYEKHGRSLDDEISDRPLTPAQTASVTRQLLEALARLHAAGYAHTDIKPDNILFDRRTGVAKLADLGNANETLRTGTPLCTREYTPPEALLGAPLTPALDHWSLGCTVFEMLTGEYLFNPGAAAARKYREFYFEDEPDAPRELTPAPVAEDRAVEKAEQYTPGTIIAEKYELLQQLGRGRFGTVWDARIVSDRELDGSFDTLWAHCVEHRKLRPADSPELQQDHRWQREKGAEDLRDLALIHEHLLLIDRLFGPLPKSLITAATFKTSFFSPDGRFLHPSSDGPSSLQAHLAAHAPRLRKTDLTRFASLIARLCHIDPARRAPDPAMLPTPRPRARKSRSLAGCA